MLALHLSQRRQHFFAVMRRIDLGPNLHDLALWINEERVAVRDLESRVAAQGAILCHNLLLFIAQQREVQTVFRAELLVTVDRIHAYAEDHSVLFQEFVLIALEIVRFNRAASGHIFWIEVENDPFAAKTVEADRFAFLRVQREIRRLLSYLRQGRLIGCETVNSKSTQSNNNNCSNQYDGNL